MQTIDTSKSHHTENARLIRELSAMLAQLSVLQSIARPDAGETFSQTNLVRLQEGLSSLEQMARDMLYEASSAEDALSFTSLPDMPLAEALARAVDETAEAMQLSSRVVFSGEEHPLSKDIEGLLYHSALAALSQVSQHSGARKLRFTLQYDNDHVVMSIEDDGVPIARAVPGLFGDDAQSLPVPPFTTQEEQQSFSPEDALFARLRNRAEISGGSLEVIASIEHGTQVQMRLPYRQQAQRGKGRINPVPTPDVGTGFILSSKELAIDATQSAPSNPIRILVVDSLAVTRAGLRHLLENYSDLLVIGEATDGVQAVSEAAELAPQVIIMDAQLPGGQSLEALRQIKLLNTDTRVLLLSTLEREEYLYETLRAGADGYVLKDIQPDELAQAVRSVARGEVLVQPQIASRLISRFGRQGQGRQFNTLDSLTARELEVLRLLARGLRNKEIAARLYVSERTVNFHLANIYQKLNVSGRTEALSKAHEQGLLTA
jgi:DNA-binding NarL/FixJ family response regulator